MPPRRLTSVEYEASLAALATAGLRELKQATVSATASANTAYTVTEVTTRRVVCLHLGAGNGDIRFRYNAAASSSSMPLIPARYVVVDAKKDDTINFFNTTAGAITVNVMEIA